MVAALLFAAVGIALAGAAGVWLMRNPYQRLHYLALPSGFSGLLVTIAVLLHDPQKQAALKVALTALALFAMNAVLTHAIEEIRMKLNDALVSHVQRAGVPARHAGVGPRARRVAAERAARAAMIAPLQILLFLLLALAGPAVVLTRNPVPQSIAVSFYGLVLAMIFFLHQAPDVALSQIVVGAIALPLMILLAVAKVKSREAAGK